VQNPGDEELEIGHEERRRPELKAAVKGTADEQSAWTLIAYNKKVLKAWERMANSSPENVINAYDWLRKDAMKWKPGRCYPLRHKNYVGCWGYEIGSGDRLYYKPDEANKIATVYYVGPHPKDIPVPPKDL
jgi:hypothetical protein